MEFKFRATDNGSSTQAPSCSTQAPSSSTQAPSSSALFFTQPLLNSGKTRFAEELVMPEIVRRREIEAEVRKEMMVERELAAMKCQRLSMFSSPSVPLLGSRDLFGFPVLGRPECTVVGFPFRRYIEVDFAERMGLMSGWRGGDLGSFPFLSEGGLVSAGDLRLQNQNEALPLVTRPAKGPAIEKMPDNIKEHQSAQPSITTILGAKRKAETPAASASANKKTKNEWSCNLCQVSTTSEKGLEDHLKGKKHKKAMEASLRSAKTREEKNDEAGGHKSQEYQKYWCQICKFGAINEASILNHQKGEKHINMLRKNGGGVIAISTLPEEVEEAKTTATKDGIQRWQLLPSTFERKYN